MNLPADSHVHSEFSWDTGGPTSAARGTMEATCARAVRIGLPALFFTEHLDLEDAWFSDAEDFEDHEAHVLGEDGIVDVPRFDVDGYLESIERCRAAFPALRIGTGLEFGQPHLRFEAAAGQFDLSRFDRINGSLHTLEFEGTRAEPPTLFRRLAPEEVIRRYLAEIPALVAGDEPFEVVTHLDYAARYWPEEEIGPFDPRAFEREFRTAMQAIAESGRALEMNTRRLWPWMPQWWAEAGGRAISFGSDSHAPNTLAHGFPEAVAMVEAYGFRPGRRPEDLWRR
ncbi:PHP domain-containing protein [Brachybacterium sacelli]|uniref:Histidinol-phosphatase (PHP family) n=1 Tax=Brachybacterium sacelli TaxID=173364 RepID=A0ABS4WY16_9MICO|nr:PHP domain-containing protein [Brachybacterium sacelli]MBP2381088.1 histidinol-phosphatase (PHP family) [Brachybacterium sacelli]